MAGRAAAWGCCCCLNLLQKKVSDPKQQCSFQVWVVPWCVTCTSQLAQLSQTAFSGSLSCQTSHSLMDIKNLNGLVLWKLIVLNKIRPNRSGTEIFHKDNCVLLSAVSLLNALSFKLEMNETLIAIFSLKLTAKYQPKTFLYMCDWNSILAFHLPCTPHKFSLYSASASTLQYSLALEGSHHCPGLPCLTHQTAYLDPVSQRLSCPYLGYPPAFCNIYCLGTIPDHSSLPMSTPLDYFCIGSGWVQWCIQLHVNWANHAPFSLWVSWSVTLKTKPTAVVIAD